IGNHSGESGILKKCSKQNRVNAKTPRAPRQEPRRNEWPPEPQLAQRKTQAVLLCALCASVISVLNPLGVFPWRSWRLGVHYHHFVRSSKSCATASCPFRAARESCTSGLDSFFTHGACMRHWHVRAASAILGLAALTLVGCGGVVNAGYGVDRGNGV